MNPFPGDGSSGVPASQDDRMRLRNLDFITGTLLHFQELGMGPETNNRSLDGSHG